jgi:hypothetical protein
MKKMNIDTRLVGRTAENVFLSLLNQRGVFATSFDTQGFDWIVFDPRCTRPPDRGSNCCLSWFCGVSGCEW